MMKRCINNFIGTPPYLGGEEVNAGNVEEYIRIEKTGYSWSPPDWIGDLIMVQANIAKTTVDGNFASGIPLLEHLAKTGVNALWLAPFFENQGNANKVSHYGNQGPQTLAADCFRGRTHAERAEELKEFVRQAHLRGIYIFADVVTYGALGTSPMFQAYKNGTLFEGMDVSGWFTGEPLYSGFRFRWESESLRRWFANCMTDLILQYDLDGFRVDSEPTYLWYDSDGDGKKDRYADIFGEVRLRVAGYVRNADGSWRYPDGAKGRKIVVFSEKNNLRDHAYDFEQHGVIHYGNETTLSFETRNAALLNWFEKDDLATSVRAGKIADGRWFTEYLGTDDTFVNRFRFYSYCISNHDSHSSVVNRRLWVMGYQALLAPFLPIWYYGEECGLNSPDGEWLNAVPVDVEVLLSDPQNRMFYERIKRLIHIRRSYPELFALPQRDIRESNVASVSVSNGALGYARVGREQIVLVLANPGMAGIRCDVSVAKTLLPTGEKHVFRDLLQDPDAGSRDGRAELCGNGVLIRDIPLDANGMAVLLVEAVCED